MTKSYREEQEAILSKFYHEANLNGLAGYGVDHPSSVHEPVINEALESLQLLHEREVTEARISELRRMVVLLPSRYSQDLLDRIHEIRNDAKRAGLKEES